MRPIDLGFRLFDDGLEDTGNVRGRGVNLGKEGVVDSTPVKLIRAVFCDFPMPCQVAVFGCLKQGLCRISLRFAGQFSCKPLDLVLCDCGDGRDSRRNRTASSDQEGDARQTIRVTGQARPTGEGLNCSNLGFMWQGDKYLSEYRPRLGGCDMRCNPALSLLPLCAGIAK